MVTRQQLIRKLTVELVEAHRAVGGLAMSDHRGHISARLPGTEAMLIKARLDEDIPNLGSVSEEHIARMTLEGKVIKIKKGLVPPGEYFMHTSIYKARPDVMSVCHIHPKYTTVLGIAGRGIRPVYHLRDAKVVGRELPVLNDPRLITNEAMGKKVVDALGERDACVLRWHGLVTVGRSVREATLRALKIETQAEYNFLALQAGGLEEIPSEYVGAAPESKSQLDADWAYFSARSRT